MNRTISHSAKRRNGTPHPHAGQKPTQREYGANGQSWYNTLQVAETDARRGGLLVEAETHDSRAPTRRMKDMQNHAQDSEGQEPPPADLDTYVDGLTNAVYKGMADEVEPHGLAPLEFNLLRACMRQEECTATQLAEILPVDASRISRVVTKLVDSGLLRRRRLRNDRRIVMLKLTEKGSELTEQIDRRVKMYDAKLTEGVTEEEMSGFVTTTFKILANFDSLSHPQ